MFILGVIKTDSKLYSLFRNGVLKPITDNNPAMTLFYNASILNIHCIHSLVIMRISFQPKFRSKNNFSFKGDETQQFSHLAARGYIRLRRFETERQSAAVCVLVYLSLKLRFPKRRIFCSLIVFLYSHHTRKMNASRRYLILLLLN